MSVSHLPSRGSFFRQAAAAAAVVILAFLLTGGTGPESYPLASAKTVTAPIFLYHSVRPGKHAYSVRPETFDAQLHYLRDSGYSFVTLGALVGHLRRGTPLPPKPAVLTFDDGWQNQYQNALPILEKHGAVATFFITTDVLGRGAYMRWDQAKELARRGMEIGSHARRHPFLARIGSEARLRDEIAGSKAILEKELGRPVTVFAYPFGSKNGRVIAAVEAAGYEAGRGVGSGRVHGPANIYQLGVVDTPDDLGRFIRLVEEK